MELTTKDLELVEKRIEQQFPASAVVEEVFPREETRTLFVDGLKELNSIGGTVKVGGRRLREMIGCKTIDFANDIVSDSEMLVQDPHVALRLGVLLKFLAEYPEKRMSQPDLDFFTWNVEPGVVAETFSKRGFKVQINNASGNVTVVSIIGANGGVTFIDGNQSWQTGESWPMFGFAAELKSEPEPTFDLNISSARIYLYPLEIPPVKIKDPLDPARFAAVSRALLWSLTVTDPNGHRLRLPFSNSERYYLDTVAMVPDLLFKIRENPELEIMYRSGLRDMSVALRICVLTNWIELAQSFGLASDRARFFNEITAAWLGSRFRS